MKNNSKIKIWYHAGPYLTRRPVALIPNLLRYRKLYKPVYNVGDQISPIIVSLLSGMDVRYVYPRIKGKLVAVGSVLSVAKDRDMIWGSGLKYPEQAESVSARKGLQICAVRGPLTRDALQNYGIECPEVYGDPALLLSTLYPHERTSQYQVGVFPHLVHVDHLANHNRFTDSEIKVITPDTHWQSVVHDLCSCKVIYSTSLHGVIFAESYGIPAVLVRHKQHLANSTFKFEDYFLSTERDFNFVESSFIFDSSNAELVEFAERQPRPRISLKRLIEAFPYPVRNQHALDLLNDSTA